MIDPRIMAVDPGESTGLAWTTSSLGELGYQTTVAPTHPDVYHAIQNIKPKILIVEWFITGQRLNQFSRRTIELCGGCEALAFVVGARLVKHTPKTRYPGMDEAERLLIATHGPRGTVQKGRGTWTDHQQDALAHLLVYEVSSRVAARLTGAAPPTQRLPLLRSRGSSSAAAGRQRRSPAARPTQTRKPR